MEERQAIRALAALAHESRLKIFRLLVRCPCGEGLAAGKIAEELKLPAATLSFHLKDLLQAGLLVARRESRSIIYSLDSTGMKSLLAFLLEDCCGGRPELCNPQCAPSGSVEDSLHTLPASRDQP